jgi:hypothetical protein
MDSTDDTADDASVWRHSSFEFEDIFAEQSMDMAQESISSFSSAPSDFDAEMGGQDPRAAGLGPAQASHGQPRPTSSQDINPLRQHDADTLPLGDAQDSSFSILYDHRFSRMYCATPRRGLLGEKQARR